MTWVLTCHQTYRRCFWLDRILNGDNILGSPALSRKHLFQKAFSVSVRSHYAFNENTMPTAQMSVGVVERGLASERKLKLSQNGRSGSGPEYLVLLVNGILASANDWNYVETELNKRLGKHVKVHASVSNSFLATFEGVDAAGNRLANERLSVIAHSLGGLIARYAIAKLYEAPPRISRDCTEGEEQEEEGTGGATMAGLHPVIFITLATPHLGVYGKRQLPFLLGLEVLEKVAPPLAPLFAGTTGRQLFLADADATQGKRPLLLQMASDCPQGPFISALGAFEERVLYANVGYDHMVGWRTSSIRREHELPKLRGRGGKEEKPAAIATRYRHVVSVTRSPPRGNGPHASSPAQLASSTRRATRDQGPSASAQAAEAYHDVLEEEMIAGLQQLPWSRVDVSFREAFWPFFAHNNIHVKLSWLHYEGAGVVAHLVDTLLEHEHKEQLAPEASL
eukprot:jgi/Mesen1/1128/ME000123S00297